MLKDSRKIAAILAADVVEYSRLTEADESGALRALKVRRAIFDRFVREFDGHEFGSVGDSLMAQFSSALNAVHCAQSIQQRIATENGSLPAEQRMSLRIGVNLGDVLEEDGALFGDGVNIAARLQSLATPGGVVVSDSVYAQVKNKMRARFTCLGSRSVKNISEPVTCYEVTEPVGASFMQRLAGFLQRPLVIAGIAAMLAVAAWQLWRPAGLPSTRVVTAQEQQSIAVLPFVDMSESKDQEYFADGLAEDVRNLLASIPNLKVIGRSSSFQFKGRNEDLRAIGAELGAAYVLEGSVRRSGDRVRVTADLIGTRDGVHQWSQQYDRAFGDVLQLQDELAMGLARALSISVSAANLHSRTAMKSPQAYEFYLRALHASDREDRDGFEVAANYLQEALRLDPTFAAAAAQLAFIHMVQADFEFAPVHEAYERARHSAMQAIRLDPGSGTPHAVLGWIHTAYDWDWPAADAELKQALLLTPHDTLALKCAARLSEILGNWSEATRLLSAALARDPLDPAAHYILSGVYVRAGRLADAEVEMHKVLDISPTYEPAPYRLGLILLARGQLTEALAAMQRTSSERLRAGGLASIYHALGRRADSDAALAWMMREHANDDAFGIAQALAFRGEIDAALQWLDRAYAQKDAGLYRIKGDPLFKGLEGDPRYRAFLQKMRLSS